MNSLENRKLSMIAVIMAFVLVSAAFLGLAMVPGVMAAPGDIDEPLPDDNILEGAGIDMDWAYSTSTVTIQINHTLVGKSANFFPVQFTIMATDGMTDMELYRWVPADGDLVNPYNWTMNLSAAGDYTITLSAVFYETVEGLHYGDSIALDFTVIDGTGVVNSIMAEPMTVDNSGMDIVNITLDIDRLLDELDDEETSDIMFWNEDTQMWGDIVLPDIIDDNVTETMHNFVAYAEMTIPMDFPVGEYYAYLHVVDIWGYEETYNATAFNVIWKEMAPEMTDGAVSFDEDMYAVVDLEDHFSDVNGQTLTYWFNETLLENIMVVWEGDMLNFTAAMDWNGEEMFTIWVSDGVNNVSFDMTITVNPMDDDLMVAMDTTILVNEDEMMATFNPLDLFYDPDGPVENLAVSLGYEEETNETTNVTTHTPIWMYEDENITVMINSTDFANSMVKVNVDVEEGRWHFPITAWIDGNVTIEGEMAYVEIVPMNDVPMLVMDTITIYKHEFKTVDLSEYFEDPDGPMLNLSVNTSVSGALLTYDWMTYTLTINPATNWTGTIEVEINATDGEDYALYTLTIEVILMSYEITGTVTFEEMTDVTVNMSMVELTIGGNVVELDENNSFSITLEEGEYAVVLTVDAMYLYNEANEQSGYVIPTLENITLEAAVTYDIVLEYMTFAVMATWEDIDFEGKVIDDDEDTIEITIGVLDENKTGYDEIELQLVIVGKDDEEHPFNMTWDNEMKKFVLELTEDELDEKGVPEGDRKYTFTDGTEETAEFEYEFMKKDENANLITVIVLIVLIILVLIALVFIMRKPSEEEFDEEDEEEEDEGDRSCPSCGESVTDEEAAECPYCGEDLEE